MSSANSIKERVVQELNRTGRLLRILNSACLSKDSPKLMDKIGSNKKNMVELERIFSQLFSNNKQTRCT